MKRALLFSIPVCVLCILSGCKKDNSTPVKPLVNDNLLRKTVVDSRQDTIKPYVVKRQTVVDARQDTIRPYVVKGKSVN